MFLYFDLKFFLLMLYLIDPRSNVFWCDAVEIH